MFGCYVVTVWLLKNRDSTPPPPQASVVLSRTRHALCRSRRVFSLRLFGMFLKSLPQRQRVFYSVFLKNLAARTALLKRRFFLLEHRLFLSKHRLFARGRHPPKNVRRREPMFWKISKRWDRVAKRRWREWKGGAKGPLNRSGAGPIFGEKTSPLRESSAENLDLTPSRHFSTGRQGRSGARNVTSG